MQRCSQMNARFVVAPFGFLFARIKRDMYVGEERPRSRGGTSKRAVFFITSQSGYAILSTVPSPQSRVSKLGLYLMWQAEAHLKRKLRTSKNCSNFSRSSGRKCFRRFFFIRNPVGVEDKLANDPASKTPRG